MKKPENAPTKQMPDTVLASLQGQVDDCSKDVHAWLAMARKLHPSLGSGSKAALICGTLKATIALRISKPTCGDITCFSYGKLL
jgi:hypothetical protein